MKDAGLKANKPFFQHYVHFHYHGESIISSESKLRNRTNQIELLPMALKYLTMHLPPTDTSSRPPPDLMIRPYV